VADLNLDDPSSYSQLDPSGMLRRIDDFARQIETAWNVAGEVSLPSDYRDVNHVVITGMGGSAIGGSLLEGYVAPECPVPVSVWRGYGLPAYVGAQALVIAVSFSGNTEETLSGLQAARAAGARLLAVSTGGQVSQLALDWRIPLIAFNYDSQPRAALGFLFTPLLHVFDELGFIPPQASAISEALEVVRHAAQDWGPAASESSNQAKQLARRVLDCAAVVYGAAFLSAVARRWKTQFNENSKNWAFFEEFPELDHNAIVGYERPKSLPDHVQVVILNSPLLLGRIGTRIEVTKRILDEFKIPWQQVEARGSDRLAHMLSLISLGDYVSYYLALLNGVDPTTIRPIDMLKEALAKS
jgi:glucose/mannose-6-phosphate isomerase